MQKLIELVKLRWEEAGALLLLFFIPLYPKLPLLDVVHTWVYIRLDDFLVAVVLLGFAAKRIKARYIPDAVLTQPILLYWIVGLVSVTWSLAFIGPKLLGYFPQLVFLHYIRRIEYMAVFFVAAVGIRTIASARRFLWVFVFAVLAVSLYGIGQRYMRFPAFLTMNEEFAKGTPLYLSDTSRITSTFAGHYDLAIYLSFAIAVFASMLFGVRSVVSRIVLVGVGVLASSVLFMTQSRVSLFAACVGVICVLWWHKRRTWIVPVVLAAIAVIPFVPGLADRFAKTFRSRPVIYDIRAGIPIGAAKVGELGQVTVEESASPALENLPIGSGFIRVPSGIRTPLVASFAVDELRALPDYPFGNERPALGEELHMAMENGRVYLSTPNSGTLATSSGDVASISGRFYLDQAIVYDISFTTRFQGTWPRAWEAFSRNFLLGSGYSVLSIASDSDLLRALGETGILGLASFLLIFFVFFRFVAAATARTSAFGKSFALGVSAGLAGLFVTALLIDVFEASKVAYTVWLSVGAVVGMLSATFKKKVSVWDTALSALRHPLVSVIFLGVIVAIVFRGISALQFVADDYTWLGWAQQADLRSLRMYFTDSSGFFYRPITKIYFFVASLLFWFKPGGYHIVNLMLHAASTVFTYLIVRKITRHMAMSFLTALLFAVLAMHHENVLWVSGVSSLLGAFFVLLSLLSWTYIRRRPVGLFAGFVGVVSAAISMFSYEEYVLVPTILFVYSWLFWPKKYVKWALVVLLLIPVYMWVRFSSGALLPEGSYAVNMTLLPFNLVGNLFGYGSLVLVGPVVLPLYDSMRAVLRNTPFVAGLMAAPVFIWLAYVIRGHLHKLALLSLPIFFASFTLLSLVPVLGLGNIAERYGYLASFGLSFLFVWFVYRVVKIRGTMFAIALFASVFLTNYFQLAPIISSWQQAGKLSERILYELRRMYYPVRPGMKFVVANVPTRIGRAWVFPVGLSDATFLTFGEPMVTVDVVGSQADALAVAGRDPDRIKALTIDTTNPQYPVREVYEK